MTSLGKQPGSKNELPIYFATLIALARGDDGRIDSLEGSFIAAQAELHGFDITPLLVDQDFSSIGAQEVPADIARSMALLLVRDGITLGYINGSISTEQKTLLYQVATKCGLGSHEVDCIEDWLLRLWAVIEEGKTLFGEDGIDNSTFKAESGAPS